MAGRQAFWSYVHQDDADEGGRIAELARLLSSRVRLMTGTAFPIFLDRDSLGWGVEWESKIREALLSTMFFIPIITPSFFLSTRCREELVSFSSSARALGLEELILPVYYTDIPQFDTAGPSGDELIDLVKRYQWEDWREVALEDAASSVHRKAVHRLATQLLASGESADAKPATDITTPKVLRQEDDEDGDGGKDGRDGDEGPNGNGEGAPGDLDILAEGEEAFQRLSQRIEQVPAVINAIAADAEEATKKIQQSDARGKGFAGRLNIAKGLANKLESEADVLEQAVGGYLDDLLKVDPMVMTVLSLLRADPSQISEVPEFLDSIDVLTNAAGEGLGSLDPLAQTIRDNAQWSKDLRKPSRRIETALRQMVDTRSLFGQWKAQIDELREDFPHFGDQLKNTST